jgi:hypothetical protein
MINFNAFCSPDWFCFAGSEKFPDGSDPLIGYLRVDGFDAIAIVDASGLHISWDVPVPSDEDEEGNPVEHEEHETNEADWRVLPYAARAIALLKPVMTVAELQALPGARVELV